MKRIHITNATIDVSRTYEQSDKDIKPTGLWYGINNEWLNWCKEHEPEWIGKNMFKLDIDMSNVLILSTVKDTIEFYIKYKKDKPWECMKWRDLAKDYDGFEIQNYHAIKYSEFLRIDYIGFLWLWGWDVDSGCIWNLKAIKSIEKYETQNS